MSGFKFDTDKIIREIQRQVTAKQEELLANLRNAIEEQYCPTHGKFAEFEGIEGDLGNLDGVQLSFTYCCEDLKKSVDDTVKSLQEINA
ncbi:hypothetical protein [Deinococcus sp.]|uniref:hypothetical protein n=1 Tax=Deinococcus sp. TaxID=47478 RepID=UPI0025B8704A|nr:hypothetical protein [Deinococcus sp.]